MITELKNKTELFWIIFFFISLKINLSNINRYKYSELISMSLIIKTELQNAIFWVLNNKTSEFDNIFNRILYITLFQLLLLLLYLYNICLNNRQYLKAFKHSVTDDTTEHYEKDNEVSFNSENKLFNEDT